MIKPPSPISKDRIRGRIHQNQRYSLCRVYPAGNKIPPPGPKKPRGPRVVSPSEFARRRMREFIIAHRTRCAVERQPRIVDAV